MAPALGRRAAAPILVRGLTGAVAVSFPRSRLAELDRIAPPLRYTADRIAGSWALAL